MYHRPHSETAPDGVLPWRSAEGRNRKLELRCGGRRFYAMLEAPLMCELTLAHHIRLVQELEDQLDRCHEQALGLASDYPPPGWLKVCRGTSAG
jgi:hypothetical protein